MSESLPANDESNGTIPPCGILTPAASNEECPPPSIPPHGNKHENFLGNLPLQSMIEIPQPSGREVKKDSDPPSQTSETFVVSLEPTTTNTMPIVLVEELSPVSHRHMPPPLISDLSEGGDVDREEHMAGNFHQSNQRVSPGGTHRKLVHDFFYPPRQQSKSPGSNHREYPAGVNLSKKSQQVSLSSSLRAPPLTSGHCPTLSKRTNDEIFEDEPVRNDSSRDPHRISVPTEGSLERSNRDGEVLSNRSSDLGPASALEDAEDKAFVEKFWTAYDEILILSLFTQVGILCRLGAASFFRYFDDVFHSGSALFTNLPLNCLSCFVMGMLCSGESLMQIIHTRFTPPRLQQDLNRESTQQVAHNHHDAQALMEEYSSDEDMMEMETAGVSRRRRKKRSRTGWQRRKRRTSSLVHLQGQPREPEVLQELREVHLLAWERRIRASVCLLLFPARQEDIDIVENYFSEGYRREAAGWSRTRGEDETTLESVHKDRLKGLPVKHENGMYEIPDDFDVGDFDDLILVEEDEESPSCKNEGRDQESCTLDPHISLPVKPSPTPTKHPEPRGSSSMDQKKSEVAENITIPQQKSFNESSIVGHSHARGTPHVRSRQYAQVEGGNVVDYGTQDDPDLDQIITNVATGVSKNISRIGRINLAEGWDVGTSPQEKSEDLCLGLRDGLCGALSSFSSWISSIVNLFREGEIGQAFVGMMLGIQLPLIAYRFGQYVSVYIFVWRCRREKRRDERRGGYGIRLQQDEGSCDELAERSVDSLDSCDELSTSPSHRTPYNGRTKGRRTVHDEESEVPSVRAIITALFIMGLVAQLTSLNFFYEPKDRLLALSLLFSPLGVLARWRMMKFNAWRPSFPIGTFACNVTACALSGSLGSLLAGNPGPRERIALVAIISGFGGTLSSVARFIVEILSLMDPILFRLDGIYYAVASAFWGLLVSFIFSASVDWADSVQ